MAYSTPETELIEIRLGSMILTLSDGTPGDDLEYNEYDNL